MSKITINVGADPGNNGDGDSLRDAFIKTQSNFDELYSFAPITDTTLDHSDSSINGSIAQQLAECELNGGGIVLIGPGTFQLSAQSLVVGDSCQIIGSGEEATSLKIGHTGDGILVAAGQFNGNWAVKNLTIDLPTALSGDGIATTALQATRGQVQNVTVKGGSVLSWGISINSANEISVDNYTYLGEGSGIKYSNPSGLPVNYGDAIFQGSTIFLKNPNTIGVALESPASSSNRINNILLSQISVSTVTGSVPQGTIGVKMSNVARVTLLNIDIERTDIGILQESAVSGGAAAKSNAFIQIFTIGCNTDYQEIGTKPQEQVVLGGEGQLAREQHLPSSDILAGHPIMGENRVLTAVRPIEAYTNSAVARLLNVEDSGKIFTNRGASNIVTFQLPSANQNFSIEFEFHLSSAGQRIQVLPASGDIIRPGQSSAGVIYASGTSFGQLLKIRNIDGNTWAVLSQAGSWG